MTSDATTPRTPIGALRISTIAMVGVLVAVSVPAATAAFAMSSRVSDRRALLPVRAAGPVSRLVVSDSVSDVEITAVAGADGVSGQGVVQWKSKGGKPPQLEQSLAGGVLTLTKDCSGGGCPIDLTLSVPPDISVQVTTSDGHILVAGVTGSVDLTSSNGSIQARNLGSGDATFRTTDGGIDASFAGAPARIAAHTTDGDVSLTTDGRTAYYDSVTADGGTVNLTNVRDRRSAREIDVTTDADVTIK